MEEEKLNRLINYAELGWDIFPVFGINNGICNCSRENCDSPGKHPRTKHGLKDATDNIDVISHWNFEFPAANWAVRTGNESNILVVDVDTKNGGVDNWQELLSINHSILEPNVKTPSGGYHYYFRLRPEQEFTNRTGSLPKGIDIRANGGYVVLPEVSVNYQLLKVFDNLDEIPDWLIETITHQPKPRIKKELIPVGERNTTLFKEACGLRGRGLDGEDILKSIMQTNDLKTEEPLAETELFEIVESAMKYDANLPCAGYSTSQLDGFFTCKDLFSMNLPEQIWTVPNLLPIGLTILAGKSKVGKSWLALQIAKAVVYEEECFGHEASKGKVLFIALEDNLARIADRLKIQGWAEDEQGFTCCFNAGFQKNIGKLHADGSKKLAKIIEEGEYKLVVIDTLGKAIFGDHNDYNKMTKALSPLQDIAFERECSVILIDHHKKSSDDNQDMILDIQGSTAKGAVSDTIIGLYIRKSSTLGSIQILGRDVQERKIETSFNPVTGTWKYEREEGELNITARRQDILDAVEELGISQIKEIADYLGLEKGNIHQSLQLLANSGLIVKHPSNGNKYYYTKPDTKKEHEKIVRLIEGSSKW